MHTPSNGANDKPYAKFEELPNEKIEDFEIVKRKIQELTNKVAGSQKQIVNKPIVLTIFSSSCPDLTIVDLPGITKISVDDQSQDIEKVTKDMAMRYITDPRTIILAVLPATERNS